MRAPRHVTIVGGGIAGLATALAVQEQAAEAGLPLTCSVIERSPHWGGKIATHRVGDLLIEAGPDSFLSQKPWALELCAKLGLADRLINTNEAQKKTFVFTRGRLRELPQGLVVIVPTQLAPFLKSGLLSWPGLARLALDLVLPARPARGDESVASFFRRRLGREAFERIVEPLMAGIYAGDAEQLSLRATFPRFLDIEQTSGSLIRGMVAARRQAGGRPSGPPTGRTMFVTLRDGLGDLVEALVARIGKGGATLMPNRTVQALQRSPNSYGSKAYTLRLDDGTQVAADSVVLATPAYVSAELLRPLNPAAAGLLADIPYASVATVSMAYQRADLGELVSGFGFVVPRAEQRDLIAATWTSLKWPHRALSSQVLVRCYVGRMGREALLQSDDETLLTRVREELRSMTGIAATPVYVEVNRWNRAMPQYILGHLDRLASIESALRTAPGLYLTGAAYRGVGIPDCIHDGSQTGQAVVLELAAPSSASASVGKKE